MAQTDTLAEMHLHEVQVEAKQTASAEMAAVTTASGEYAERLGIATMRGMSEIVPNFYIPDYGSHMTSSIYVRGLGARIDQPVVGLSVDGVPILNKNNYDFDLLDIDSIEIFRGAQSILNGRNTMCGQVNIYTLSPWRAKGWRFMAEYGRFNSVKVGAGWYGQLSPKAATSLTAYFTSSDGYFRNEHDGQRLDHEKQGAARWKLALRPSSRLSLTNTLSAQVSRQGGYPYASVATGQIAYNDTCFYRRFSMADGLTATWAGDGVTVTSQTSAQYIDDNVTLDQDFLPLDYFTLTQRSKEWTLTEDVYVRGRHDAYSWLAGAFAFYKDLDMHAPVTFKDDGIKNLIEAKPNQMNPYYPISWDERRFVLGSEFENYDRGFAIYHQSHYEWENWDFELGLRWDLEWVTLDYRSHCRTGYTTWRVLPDGSREVYRRNPLNIDDGGRLRRHFGQLLPKIAVGYSPSPVARVYVNIAKGYKAGGFNSQMFSDVLQQRIMALMGLSMGYDVDEIVGYDPEKSWNFELGGKWNTLGGKLDVTGTLFYIICLDQQLTTFPSGLTTGRIMTNAGRTNSCGIEATAQWQVADGLSLRASYGYTYATFRKYNNGQGDFRGKRLPYAPANTAFASVTYDLPCKVLGSRPQACVSVRGIGNIYWDEANTVAQPFYATLGASVALERDRWSLRLWGENLTSARYDTFYFVSVGNAFVQRARPWSVGATIRFNL